MIITQHREKQSTDSIAIYSKAIRGSVTGESAIKPEYTGKGTLVPEPPKIGVIMAVSILVAIQIPSTVQISSPKPQKIYENAQPKPRKPLKLQAFQPVSKSVGNAMVGNQFRYLARKP